MGVSRVNVDWDESDAGAIGEAVVQRADGAKPLARLLAREADAAARALLQHPAGGAGLRQPRQSRRVGRRGARV